MRLPWTQLSASPRIVFFRWNSVVDHIDHAVLTAPRWWTMTRPRKGTTRSRGRAAVEARAERSTRVHRFGCGVRLPSPQNNRGVGEWRDGLANGGSSRGW